MKQRTQILICGHRGYYDSPSLPLFFFGQIRLSQTKTQALDNSGVVWPGGYNSSRQPNYASLNSEAQYERMKPHLVGGQSWPGLISLDKVVEFNQWRT